MEKKKTVATKKELKNAIFTAFSPKTKVLHNKIAINK